MKFPSLSRRRVILARYGFGSVSGGFSSWVLSSLPGSSVSRSGLVFSSTGSAVSAFPAFLSWSAVSVGECGRSLVETWSAGAFSGLSSVAGGRCSCAGPHPLRSLGYWSYLALLVAGRCLGFLRWACLCLGVAQRAAVFPGLLAFGPSLAKAPYPSCGCLCDLRVSGREVGRCRRWAGRQQGCRCPVDVLLCFARLVIRSR